MQLFYAPDLSGKPILPEDEAKHCIKILRHKTGDIIDVTDGKGYFYSCKILNSNNCSLEIIEKRADPSKRDFYFHLAVAPTKSGERTDWMIEKAVEFGIDELSFLNCDHNERSKINIERCDRIAISAMKQSLKANLVKINDIVPFHGFIKAVKQETRFIAHCDSTIQRKELNKSSISENILCCIGPEGDFSKPEIGLAMQNGFESIKLGDSRLRTETAAIAVCAYLYFQ
jgi:16S rRNA (uracil1498-N3)-methyltransferase